MPNPPWLRLLGTALFAAAVLLAPLQAHAEPDPREIMRALLDRNDGTTEVSRQQLSTCRYAIKERRKICAETPRVKVMESVRKDYGAREKDKKSVSILLDPPGERGIGFLQFDYEDTARDSDQWMYSSAMSKTRRIVSGSEDEPKTGSFFGSEFSYEDLEQRHLDDYTYRLVKSDVYRERDCWVVESTPTPAHARKSNYSKTILWIDKERNLILKSILVDRQGKKAKRVSTRKVTRVNGVWVPMVTNIDNLQTKRMSILALQTVVIDVEVGDDFLTLRTLSDGAFRESRLQNYRRYLTP